MARADRGHLYIVYVIQIARRLPLDAEIEEQVARGEQVLHRAERLTRMPRGDVDTQLLQAREVGPAVVHEAVMRNADAIVIGTGYPTEFGQFSLGEDIPYILEHAPCDVLLWRDHPPARATGEETVNAGRTVRA